MAEEKPPAPAPARQGLFSPGGYIVMLAIVLVEGVAVYSLGNYLAKRDVEVGSGADIAGAGQIVNVDDIVVQISVGADGRRLLEVSITPAVQLKRGVSPQVVDLVQRQRPQIRHRIAQIVSAMDLTDLTKRDVREHLAGRIKDALNEIWPQTVESVWIESYLIQYN